MFADRARIIIRSGKGGDGHVSFRRELFVPDGGPDGGDGGKGGDVIFEVDKGLNTLIEYRHRRKFSAQDGEPGGKRRCHGANGEDIVLRVPEGTVIKEAESGQVIADMSGGIISFQVKQIKPNAEIYQSLLRKYNLVADECLFFDDRADNTEGARKQGIHAITVTSRQFLVDELDKIIAAKNS